MDHRPSVVASAGAHWLSWRAVSGDDAKVPPKVRGDGIARGWVIHMTSAPSSPPREVFRAMRISFLQRTLFRESPGSPTPAHWRRPKLFRFPPRVIRTSPTRSQPSWSTIEAWKDAPDGHQGYVKAWQGDLTCAERRLIEAPCRRLVEPSMCGPSRERCCGPPATTRRWYVPPMHRPRFSVSYWKW